MVRHLIKPHRPNSLGRFSFYLSEYLRVSTYIYKFNYQFAIKSTIHEQQISFNVTFSICRHITGERVVSASSEYCLTALQTYNYKFKI